MNVNIWGPPAWDLLQSCAFILDAQKKKDTNLFSLLIELLPCVHCRNSYKIFYEETMNRPVMDHSMFCYTVHSLVNEKLFRQRLEKLVPNVSSEQFIKLKPLMDQPSFLVVQKRFAVNSDEPISFRSLTVFLLSLCMAWETQEEKKSLLQQFIYELKNIANMINNQKLVAFLDELVRKKSIAEMKNVILLKKYGNGPNPSEYIRAGSCFNGTCK